MIGHASASVARTSSQPRLPRLRALKGEVAHAQRF